MSVDVISIKKYLEPDTRATTTALLQAYRSTLESAGREALHVCPAVGTQVQHQLLLLMDTLQANSSTDAIADTGRQVDLELREWGLRAAGYYADRATEVKEIMLVVARSAEAVGAKDQRYCGRLNEFTSRLESLARLDDLTEIRDSIMRDAHELRLTAEHMQQESIESISGLRKELTAYQERAEEAERQASLDQLTGVFNRRGIEAELDARILKGHTFCVLVLDMDDFKKINDTYGHLAGDEVLIQFADEIKSRFRDTDCVGRWGGDEFIILLNGGIQAARGYADRLKEWVFGEYSVRSENGVKKKVLVQAAIGVAQWETGETAKELLLRADGEMYGQKNRQRRSSR